MNNSVHLKLGKVPDPQSSNVIKKTAIIAKAPAAATLVFSLPNMATAAAARANATPPVRHDALGAKRRGYRPYQRQMEMD
jgi:hypothetical protein